MRTAKVSGLCLVLDTAPEVRRILALFDTAATSVTSLAAMRLLTVVNVYMAASTTTALLVPYTGPMSVRLHASNNCTV